MKSQLIAIVAAVLVVGCGGSSIHDDARYNKIEAVKKHLAAGTNMNTKNAEGKTPLDSAIQLKLTETANLLRKHGGKTGEELKAEGK